MKREELVAALNRIGPETGSLCCLGCGYEHGCSVHGCAVIKAAVAVIEAAPLPPPPLTLEELREMKWEPAWVDGDRETEIGRNGWAIIWHNSVDKYVCIWWPGEDCANIPSLNSYMDTWTAYRRKPEEGAIWQQ